MFSIYNLLFSIIVLVVIIFLLNTFKINIFKLVTRFFTGLLDKIAEYNTLKAVERIKKNKILLPKTSTFTKYNKLAEALIGNYNLPLTLDGFNTLVGIIFSVLIILSIILLKNFILSILVSVSIIIAGFTYFLMQSRLDESSKIEAIMDAEDLICPLARDGVLIAIKKVLESHTSINPSIRRFFIHFVDNCENHGFTFKRAMTVLNRQLGPKFDNFAEKAIVFEYNERKGMADIFLDIVDENAAIREINIRKNRIFKEMNKEFIIKTAMVFLFVLYSLTGTELRHFMLSTDLGRAINGITIVTICLSFARCQALQRDIIIKKGGR